jgi:hypothetical protein
MTHREFRALNAEVSANDYVARARLPFAIRDGFHYFRSRTSFAEHRVPGVDRRSNAGGDVFFNFDVYHGDIPRKPWRTQFACGGGIPAGGRWCFHS